MQHGMGGAGPVGKTRNLGVFVLLGFVTCFIYWVVAAYLMAAELKAYLKSDDINPIFALICPLNYLMYLKCPELMLEAKRRAGVPNPKTIGVVGYLLLGPFAMLIDLNEVWNPTGQNSPG